MAQSLSAVALIALLGAVAPTSGVGAKPVLRWRDEFKPCAAANCVNGIDTTKWGFELGDGTTYGKAQSGWGNQELQCYTSESRNAVVKRKQGTQDGTLFIMATYHAEGYKCANAEAADSVRNWTSARMVSKAKAAFMWANATTAVGVEARLKVPAEPGAWAAFWMMPDTNRTDCSGCGAYSTGWCASGAIDLMKHRNAEHTFYNKLVFGGTKEAAWQQCEGLTAAYNLTADSSLTSWKVVSIVWSQHFIHFYLDGHPTLKISSDQWYSGSIDKAANPLAPFDQPFYLIFNLGVGGTFAGMEPSQSSSPLKYQIDYVRVYDVPLAADGSY